MIIHNNSTLKAWLKESGVHESHGHAHDDPHFDVDEAEFRRELSESAARHPGMSAHNLEIRAAYHLLRKPRREAKRDKTSYPVAADTTKIEKLLLAAVILLGICLVTIFAGLAKGDPTPKAFINESRIRAAVVEAMAEPVGGIVIQLQNGGTTLATRGGGLVVFNCTGAGLTCSFSGSTFTMNGSGGAGTGCIPPGTTANAVLFDAGAGACSDVSKLTWNSVTSTITLATGGVFDPTAGTVKVPGTTGQLLFNNGGNLGAEDPIVSGPTAIGSAPSTNPVFVAGWDGTNIRALTLLNSAPAGTEYGIVTRNIPSGTQTVSVSGTPNVSVTNTPAVTSAQLPAALDGSGFLKVHEQGTAAISVASLPLPTGAATEATLSTLNGKIPASPSTDRTTAAAPFAMRLSDGAVFYKPTTPADTQPVSLASVPLPANAAQETGGNLASIKTDVDKIPSLGAATKSGAVPVTLATDGDPCGPQNAKSYVPYDAATNGATQLVALSSGKIIYVCSYSFTSSSATANTVKLVYGTGTNCATGQTAMTPGIILQAAASTGPIGKVNPNSAGLQTAASNALCILTNATVAAQAEVSYVQQ